MGKIGRDIQQAIWEMAGNSKEARINLRARQVRDRYKSALEAVYRDSARLFLDHTNNVYIMNKEGVKTLIVYVDESIFAAELNAQRELIKLKLLELFGEDIEEFEIHISRGNYKNNHPYTDAVPTEPTASTPSVPLDDSEKAYVSETVSRINDPRLREVFKKAMTADMEWKKGEQGIIYQKK